MEDVWRMRMEHDEKCLAVMAGGVRIPIHDAQGTRFYSSECNNPFKKKNFNMRERGRWRRKGRRYGKGRGTAFAPQLF